MTRLLKRVSSVVLVERREPSGVTWGVYDEAVEPERVEHCGADQRVGGRLGVGEGRPAVWPLS